MSDITSPDIYDDGTTPTDTTDTTVSMTVDTDQDGFAETTVIDFEGDGVADAFDMVDPNTGTEQIAIDTDGDGLVDTVVADTDGDGVFDVGASDSDGDGKLDIEFDPTTGETHQGPFSTFDDGSTYTDDPNSQDDPNLVDDTVHGEPMAEIPYHQAQAGSNDCLPTSVAMVLSEVTGSEVPASDVVDLANELGLLGDSGMSLEGGLQLLEHYGIDAEVQTGSLDELRTMLDQDVPVIIGLDSDDLYGAGDAPFADNMVAGHAVVITGIDDEAGLVYINDPGFPDGAGVAIPISEFEDAWNDADHGMIVASDSDATDGTGTDSSSTDSVDAGSAGNVSAAPVGAVGGDDDSLFESVARLVLLPFDLVLR